MTLLLGVSRVQSISIILILSLLRNIPDTLYCIHLGCIEETREPVEGTSAGGEGLMGGDGVVNATNMDGMIGEIDDGVTQEELNLTCFNLMIDVLNSQMELQV